MNSERPDNDDAEAGAGAAEPAGTARGAEETTGAAADPPEHADAQATEEAGERAGAETGDGRSGRRRPALAAASVAAAVLLAGGGGAYLATTASGGTGGSGGGTSSGASGDDTPPPLALDGYAAPAGPDGAGVAPGEPNPYGVVYKADGPLPDGPGEAAVYRTKGEVTKEEVARLAKALGVEGAPVERGRTWTVGAVKDGSGPVLRVNVQAPGTWTFHRAVPGTDDCKKGPSCAVPPANAEPVSEAAAKKAAAPVLKAVGQDTAKLDATQVMGAQRVVNAQPVVGGLPTQGWTTGVTVGARGEVAGGSGQLKVPSKGDTYPVLDAERTLALMNAAPGAGSRAGVGGCASPVPLDDEGPAELCAPGKPEKETLTVERAVFGLAAHPVQGRQTLVPSWLFEVRSPGAQETLTVTYPAVDPEYLVSTAPSAAPSDEPASAPATRDVDVTGYTTAGTELTVHFTGGVCASYEAKATGTGDEVRVTVTETSQPGKVCILIAKEYELTVPLDEPLGDRTVVGSDGEKIPLAKPGARLPAPSGTR
ncbi:hypothetical protein ACLGIH_25105 [Streptomyces sp. HMX87]|uniref:hypothetical protein n=1 Tax=Streptomyces sp. HMX87 TaxID=3390849 RepID=UPI003A89A4E2